MSHIASVGESPDSEAAMQTSELPELWIWDISRLKPYDTKAVIMMNLHNAVATAGVAE